MTAAGPHVGSYLHKLVTAGRVLMLSPATIAALRADYTDVSPTRESPDPRLVALFDEHARVTAELTELRNLQAEQQRAFVEGLRVATAPLVQITPLKALRDAVTALLPDLRSAEDESCTVCGEALVHTDDCPVWPLILAYRAVGPKGSHPDGHDASWCACAECSRWRASLTPKSSPRRVPGRPAGQRIAEEPTAEARELLGLDVTPDRAALLSLYHDDATDLLDRALKAQHEPDGLHLVHAALVEALANAHTNGRPLDVATTVPDETIQAGGRFFVFDGESYDDGYRTLDEARAAAERTLAECREIAEDSFWPEEARGIAYGEVRGKASASSVEDPDRDISGDPDEIIDIQLIEVPRG